MLRSPEKKIDKIKPLNYQCIFITITNPPTQMASQPTTTIMMDTETLNKIALYAVEINNTEVLQSVLKKGQPTNLKEGLEKAIEMKNTACVKILMDLAPAPAHTTPA